MLRTFSLTIILFILLCFLQIIVNAQEITNTQISGKYLFGHSFGFSTINIAEDGKYAIESADCTTEYNRSGIYRISGSVLIFNGLNLSHEKDGFEKKTIEQALTKDSVGYKMIVVKWDTRVYLIPEENMKDFYNAVNLGIEPRLLTSSEPYYTETSKRI